MALLRFEVIAELGVNCQGSVEKAKKMIQATKLANGDWVKGQYFKIEDFDNKLPDAKLKALLECELSIEDLRELKKEAEHLGLGFCATPMKNPQRIEEYMELEPKVMKVREADGRNEAFMREAVQANVPLLVSIDPTKGPYAPPYAGRNAMWLMLTHPLYPPPLVAFERSLPLLNKLDGFSSHFPDPRIPRMAVMQALLRKRWGFWLELHVKVNDDELDAPVSLTFQQFKEVADFAHTTRKWEDIFA